MPKLRTAAVGWTAALALCLAAPPAAAGAPPKRPGAQAAKAKAKPVSPKQRAANEALFAAVDQFIPTPEEIRAALAGGADVDARDAEGWTPLMVASTKSNPEGIQVLLAAKASINAATGRGATALMIACAHNQWMVIPVLLAAGADLAARDANGATPLIHCATKAGASAIDALLAAGADRDAVTATGESALFTAIVDGNGSGARALFKAGARSLPEAGAGLPLLARAVLTAEPEAVRVALKVKPGPNVLTDRGHTPLMIASELGYAEMVADLLRAGADPAIQDPEGKNAQHFAEANQHAEIAAMLQGHWPRPRLPGTTLSVPCDKLGGPVDVNFQAFDTFVGLTVTYPRPVSSILGGFYDEPDRHGYKESSADIEVFFDTDANPKTGAAAGDPARSASRGAEYALSLREIGTSVRVDIGEGKEKTVGGQVLSASFEKVGGSGPDPDGTFHPQAVNAGGVVMVQVPRAALGVTGGRKVRVVAEVALCSRKEGAITLK